VCASPLADAAHALPPSVGQGANTAFEDAWELGEALRSHSSLRCEPLPLPSIILPSLPLPLPVVPTKMVPKPSRTVSGEGTYA